MKRFRLSICACGARAAGTHSRTGLLEWRAGKAPL
jgi:hypothetical protein